jgi:hypothetical protein
MVGRRNDVVTSVFFSYAHADEDLRDTLEKHLAALKHQGLIDTWHDRRIMPGDDFAGEIAANVEEADIILLLVSSDFLASRYCYEIEMKRAIERHQAGEAWVIPVILRACDWHDTPFGKLQAVPKDGRPVRQWPDLDQAFLDIVQSIKKVLRETAPSAPASAAPTSAAPAAEAANPRIVSAPRSSNLRTRKTFTEADQDAFRESSFEYMASFFENSLGELQNRDAILTTRFRRIDSTRFTAVIYRSGAAVARCKIMLGGMFGRGITYSSNDQAGDNSCNESLSVEHDDLNLYLKPMGIAHTGQREAHLSPEGAAEYYWSMLMAPLQ